MLDQFVGSYHASGTNQDEGGSSGNIDNMKLAHSLDMGVFCISPNDKGGMLYKPSKVGALPAVYRLVHVSDAVYVFLLTFGDIYR